MITARELTDQGICPTCYNREHDFCVFGDDTDKRIYENQYFDCILCGNPRAAGHTLIISKKHYKDMTQAPERVCHAMFKFARIIMGALQEVYKCESVYLCTMCDGPMNHFHLQLIPRYECEERGSKNFVKPRQAYVKDTRKLNKLRALVTKALEK